MIKIIVLSLIGLLTISTIYHKIRKKVEFKKNPPPGKMIKIGEDKMHIYGQGEGSPTLVFTCGLGIGFTLGNFYKSFTKLAENNRALVYDRCGYGWSDSTSRSRTLKQINEDLYKLLNKSQESGPYVLIGHSLGATEVLQFAQRYPELVAGVVMLDGFSPSFYKKGKFTFLQHLFIYCLANFIRTTGILRILKKLNVFTILDDSYPERIIKLTNMMLYNKAGNKNNLREINELVNSDDLENNLGDIPLLFLGSDHSQIEEKNKELYQRLIENKKKILNLSQNSMQKTIKDSGHFFPIKKSEVVTKEILSFLDNMID